MGRMKELDMCISQIAQGNRKLKDKIRVEMQAFLCGERPLKALSAETQYAVELWQTNGLEEFGASPSNAECHTFDFLTNMLQTI